MNDLIARYNTVRSELEEQKDRVEKKLISTIHEVLSEFHEETGLSVRGIDAYFIDTTYAGGDRESILSGIKIELNLKCE